MLAGCELAVFPNNPPPPVEPVEPKAGAADGAEPNAGAVEVLAPKPPEKVERMRVSTVTL